MSYYSYITEGENFHLSIKEGLSKWRPGAWGEGVLEQRGRRLGKGSEGLDGP